MFTNENFANAVLIKYWIMTNVRLVLVRMLNVDLCKGKAEEAVASDMN